jgi:hypothetical protein
MDDPFRPITEEERRAAEADKAQAPPSDDWTPVTPIPRHAFNTTIQLVGREPDKRWTFRDATGQPLALEYR